MRRPTVWMLMLLMLGVATAARAQSDAAEMHVLQPRFEAGRESRFEMWGRRTQDVTMEFFGQEHAVSNTLESTAQVHWVVNRVQADGSAQCTLRIEWIVFTAEAEGEKIEIDTRKPGKPASPGAEHMADIFVAMTKESVPVSVAADGSVTSVDVAALARRGKIEDQTAIDNFEKNFMEYASRLATLPYAPAKLAVGGSWDATFDWAHDMGTLKYDSTYALDSVEWIADIPVANVSIESKNKLVFDNMDQARAAGAKVTIRKNDGSETAQVMFDLQRGEVVGYNSVRKLSVEVHVSQEGQSMKTKLEEHDLGQVLRIEEVK